MQASNDDEGLEKLSDEGKEHLRSKHPEMSAQSDVDIKDQVKAKMGKGQPVLL